jgi:hypothetical protein
VTTADGWRAVAHSVRWGPLLAAPLLGCAALIVARAMAGPAAGRLALIGTMGRALICVSAAFLVDDPAVSATPAAPVTVRRRLIMRAVLGLPVAVLGWIGLVVSEQSLTDGNVSYEVIPALALTGVAIGLAAMAGRHGVDPSPGAVGAAGVAAITTAATVVPPQWAAHAPHGSLVAGAAGAIGLAAVWIGTAEPRP